MTPEERLSRLERILNADRFDSPRIGEYEWSAEKHSETASGDLNVYDNLRQLRIDQAKVWGLFADCAKELAAQRKENVALRADVAALKEAVTSSGTISGTVDVIGALASLNIHARQNKLGIGMVPDEDDSSALHIGGDASAVILGRSNTKRTDGQNPDEVHTNTLVVADGDGGMRLRQYFQWVTSGKKRNTLNRRASILALDSMGDLCKSTEEVGATSDGGQSWYIRTRGNVVEFCTYKVGAFIRILKSVSQYGATDDAQL